MESIGIFTALLVGITVGVIAVIRLVLRFFFPDLLYEWFGEFVE